MICERCQREIESIPFVVNPALFVRELSLDSLPSLSAKSYEQLPRVSAVYFVVVDGQVSYIGQSLELTRRWRHHPLLKRVLRVNAVILWVEIRGEQLRDVEKAAIVHYRPAWNGDRLRSAKQIGDTVSPPARTN